MAKGTVPNPYCTCDPCRCEVPCTCGLEAVRRTESTWWDRNDSALRHEITTIYKPAIEQPPPPKPADGHRGHGTEAREVPGTGFPVSLTPADDVAASLEYTPETAKNQIIAWAGLVSDHGHVPGHGSGHESVRTGEHNGHQFEIRTTYQILVDGQELAAHFGVSQDGTTHYHGLPNYQRSSAVDLVKDIIEQFPEDFPQRGED